MRLKKHLIIEKKKDTEIQDPELSYSRTYKKGRSKDALWDEAFSVISKNCMMSAKAFISKKTRIFRGHPKNQSALIVDPTKGVARKSANTANYYTMVIDHSKRWAKYPKRSRSIICTNDIPSARAYGYCYAVFPYDGSKIGVCDGDDFWMSFRRTVASSGDIDTINSDITRILRICRKGNEKSIERAKGSRFLKHLDLKWGAFKKRCNEFDEWVKANGNLKGWYVWDLVTSEVNVEQGFNWLREYNGSLLNLLEDLYDPDKNNFEIIKPGDAINAACVELWTDGKSVLINLEKMILTDVLERLAEL